MTGACTNRYTNKEIQSPLIVTIRGRVPNSSRLREQLEDGAESGQECSVVAAYSTFSPVVVLAWTSNGCRHNRRRNFSTNSSSSGSGLRQFYQFSRTPYEQIILLKTFTILNPQRFLYIKSSVIQGVRTGKFRYTMPGGGGSDGCLNRIFSGT